MEESIVKVHCDVNSCKYNVEGVKCNKREINIENGLETQNEHFCKSYEKQVGFGKEM